jgi:hypothetical protein
MQIAQLVKTALDETRMLVLGAQILLGFEFSGVFRDGFESLPMHARYLDGIALLLMIITVAFLITPESYHQIVDIGTDTGRFHRLISRMAGVSLLPFALSLGIALFITGEVSSVSQLAWLPAVSPGTGMKLRAIGRATTAASISGIKPMIPSVNKRARALSLTKLRFSSSS